MTGWTSPRPTQQMSFPLLPYEYENSHEREMHVIAGMSAFSQKPISLACPLTKRLSHGDKIKSELYAGAN